MSELINGQAKRTNFRWQLLTTVSAIALLGVTSVGNVRASDSDPDRPTVWIELGAQIDRLDGGQEPLAPPFLTEQPRPDFEKVSPLATERLPRYGVDMDGKIRFEPKGTDWVFTAAVRYGRSNGNKHVHQQTPGLHTKPGKILGTAALAFVSLPGRFDDTKAKHDESHMVLDFAVGKDVGLGLFGKNGNSTINVGARFAQFSGTSQINLSSNPDVLVSRKPAKYVPVDVHHSYRANQSDERNFHGVGPSISWEASAPFMGNKDTSEISLDWGMNGAVLFGRQKAIVGHQTHATSFHNSGAILVNGTARALYHHTATRARSHSVVVPNVGGFAGLSFQYSNAKVSFGYRADFFFGAMDGGIDTRQSEDRGFYGPFATISIGLGG